MLFADLGVLTKRKKRSKLGFLHNMGLVINLKNINLMIFQKRPSNQDYKYRFKLDNKSLEHTENYLCINISSTIENINKAVDVFRDMAKRALCIKTETPIQNLAINIQTCNRPHPIAHYECEVRGLLTIQKSTNWDKLQAETLQVQFCFYS